MIFEIRKIAITKLLSLTALLVTMSSAGFAQDLLECTSDSYSQKIIFDLENEVPSASLGDEELTCERLPIRIVGQVGTPPIISCFKK